VRENLQALPAAKETFEGRIVSSQELKWNIIETGEVRPARHDAHHKIPNEALRDHALAQEALGRGGYDPDRAENGLFLPESEGVREASDLPIHKGGHPQYNQLALAEGNSIEARLIERYGALDAVPDLVLDKAMSEWERRMDAHVRNPDNWTPDGRLA
jgi:hypothetical protein